MTAAPADSAATPVPAPDGAAAGLADRRLLAVSFAYPPAASPRAVQVSRLLKHLPVRTALVCSDYDRKDRVDQSLVREAEAPLARCLRVPFEPSAVRGLLGRVASRYNLPLVDKVPDRFRPWKRAVLAAVGRFARAEGYAPDVLATFGSPMSDHLVGLALKRRFGVPWVAHFSDPWADNPFLDYDPLTQRLNRALEARVLREADRLVFTSEETVDLVASRHPRGLREKSRVLPHAFEPEAFPAPEARAEAGVVVRYVGEFYWRRSPAPLFAALRHLLAAEPAALAGVRFELVGAYDEAWLRGEGLESLPEGLVVVRPPVGYRESLRLMTSADGLLVVDAPAEVSVFLPSKLIDYVGAARPVFGVTPPGAAATLVRRLGGRVADPSDAGGVAAELKEFIALLRVRRGDPAPWGDARVRRGFEAPAVARAFAEILR